MAGTWKFEDGFWCRTISVEEGNPPDFDCQKFEQSGSQLIGTRDRGNGTSFTYEIE